MPGFSSTYRLVTVCKSERIQVDAIVEMNGDGVDCQDLKHALGMGVCIPEPRLFPDDIVCEKKKERLVLIVSLAGSTTYSYVDHGICQCQTGEVSWWGMCTHHRAATAVQGRYTQ